MRCRMSRGRLLLEVAFVTKWVGEGRGGLLGAAFNVAAGTACL